MKESMNKPVRNQLYKRNSSPLFMLKSLVLKKTAAILLFCFFLLQARSQSPALARVLDSFIKQTPFSGVVLVASEGKVELLEARGLSDRKLKLPIRIHSKFRIASMTKVFTAVLVMKLVESGKIQLDQPIARYYPEYAGEGRTKVTIDQLLRYASGIENKLEPLGMKPYQQIHPLDAFIKTYCSGKLVDTPGTKSNYANTEYIILHKIIEKVSGKKYADYLNEVILAPLKMTQTGICTEESNKGVVKSYRYSDSLKTFTADPAYFPQQFFGSGFLYSTVQDLLAFDQAIFKATLLRKETTALLLNYNEALGYTAYGFWGSPGWGNFPESFYYRTGGIQGASSNWIHTMETRKTILVLSNSDAANLYELSEQLYIASKKKS